MNLNALEVNVVEPDRESCGVACDAIISHIEEEVLVNDLPGEKLGIVLLGLASGRWRFATTPQQGEELPAPAMGLAA